MALELVAGGAVLINENDGRPLAVEPLFFRGAADAEAFIRWLGEPCGRVDHLRDLARLWAGGVRDMLRCPTCDVGRVRAGEAQCETCRDDAAFERERTLNHEREPGRNLVGGTTQ